jgi:hypothetical protein
VDEYTETFAKFILSAKKEYDVLCERVAAGEIPVRHNVTILIEIPADDVDRIRFDLIAATNGNLDGGI